MIASVHALDGRQGGHKLAVLYAPGAVSARDLLALSAEKDLRLVCVPAADAPAETVRVLGAAGEVVGAGEPSISQLAAGLTAAGVSGVVTFADAELVRSAHLSAALDLPGLPVAAAELATSKFSQRRALNAAGLAPVQTVQIVDGLPPEARRLRFPAILKPDDGAASRDTVGVKSADEAVAALGATPTRPLVLESLIVADEPLRDGWLGDYVSVESAVFGGRIVHLGVTDRLPLIEPFREQGAVVPSSLSPDRQEALRDTATRAIEALGIDNTMVHTELKLAGRAGTVIEVNARLGGYVDTLYRRAGVGSLLHRAVDIAFGAPPQPAASADRVVSVIIILPPIPAVRLLAAPEPREVMALPGVWRVDRHVRPDESVQWRDGTIGRVMEVWVEGADTAELRERLDRIRALLAERLRFATRE